METGVPPPSSYSLLSRLSVAESCPDAHSGGPGHVDDVSADVTFSDVVSGSVVAVDSEVEVDEVVARRDGWFPPRKATAVAVIEAATATARIAARLRRELKNRLTAAKRVTKSRLCGRTTPSGLCRC